MPFPVGQVWFLHTLFIITLISPLYFIIQKKNEIMLFMIMATLIFLSGVQLFIDIDNLFYFKHNNLYKPLVHSSFYIFGIIAFSSNRMRSLKFTTIFFVSCIALSVILAQVLNLNIDYEFHTFAPDLYYVAGSFSAIFIALIFQKKFPLAIQSNFFIEYFFKFFHRHTFSIFLLHSFAIYLSETIGGLVNPQEKTITYGIVKLMVVLIITCLLVIPFSKLSAIITTLFLQTMRSIKIFT